MKPPKQRIACALFALVLITASATTTKAQHRLAAVRQYAIIALPARFDVSGGFALNKGGEVAGSVEMRVSGGVRPLSRVAVWSPAHPRKLRVFPASPKTPLCRAGGINDNGVVCGYAGYVDGGASSTIASATLWTKNGKWRDRGTLSSLSFAVFRAVNNRGQAVGTSESGMFNEFKDGMEPIIRAVYQGENGPLIDLGDGKANAINENGQVVGTTGGRIALWQVKVGKGQRPRLLGRGEANDINERGQIVGASDFNRVYFRKIPAVSEFPYSPAEALRLPTPHAFLWQNNHLRDLGTLPNRRISRAVAVNNGGQIVGYCEREQGDENARPFLWRDGKIEDLNRLLPARSGWVLRRAYDINDRGQIVGEGLYKGEPRVFLLTLLP